MPSNLLSNPPRLPLVAPSILSADFARLGEECRQILDQGGDLLHLDVMDGHFVPNLTMGPALCKSLRKALPDTYLDVHLMVTDPGMYFEPFAKAGANNVTFHIEAVGAAGVENLVAKAHSLGLHAGLAINPPTPVEKILSLVQIPDMVLVMSVNPGFSGQAFIQSSLDKTRLIKPKLRPNQRLQMDGGIGVENAPIVREAGCDVLVAASALFNVPSGQRGQVITALRGTP
jgi:ribulose-phosphate 3-epimerase